MKKEEYERLKKILFFLDDLNQISCYLKICDDESFNQIKKFNELYEPISLSQKKRRRFNWRFKDNKFQVMIFMEN